MMKYKFGFIGCGNMGGALCTAVAKKESDAAICVCDGVKEKTDALCARFSNLTAVSLTELIAESEYVFLGVKPQSLPGLFDSIKKDLANRRDIVFITMAAGKSIADIEALCGFEPAIIRIMTNTPVSVGKGVILFDRNAKVGEKELTDFRNALSDAGVLCPIPEAKIDAAGAVSGCGPAFVYMFIEALADGAVLCGIPRSDALLYAAATIEGAARLAIESGEHPEKLKDNVCSPGGTTIAGVKALEDAGFRAAAINAVEAAYEKTLKLK